MIRLLCLIVLGMFYGVPVFAATRPVDLSRSLSGKILIETESYDRLWYVNPDNHRRYYLKNVSGRIIIPSLPQRVVWRYVGQKDGLSHVLKDGARYDDLKKQGTPITDAKLRAIPMNTTQLVQDTAFAGVAYELLRDGKVVKGKNAGQILSPASMSKLVTALVLLDQSRLDWDKKIVINQDVLDYPVLLAGQDATSEIDLRLNDVVSTQDLWVAMLVASSNQAAIALVDNSGLSRKDFVAAMNAKVAALGLKHSIFFDPTGLDPHNVTTSHEMALIARTALNTPAISLATKKDGYVITTQQIPSHSVTVVDRNISLKTYKPDAAKTGFLVEAQRCVALKKGHDIIVVMHALSTKQRNKILDALTSI